MKVTVSWPGYGVVCWNQLSVLCLIDSYFLSNVSMQLLSGIRGFVDTKTKLPYSGSLRGYTVPRALRLLRATSPILAQKSGT